MKKTVMILAIAATLTGCGRSVAQPTPPPSGEPFLPAYMEMLKGSQPGDDPICHPKTLEEMLIPCDIP